MWKLLLPFGLLFAVVIASLLADRPLPRADVVFINRGDVNTLDLQRMSWMQDLRAAAALFEGLVVNDVFSRDFDKKPGVAERWEISPDGKTYSFWLRKNAKWSNGAPVTANDFKYSWRRALLPDLAADYAGLFMLIEGGKAFYDWRTEAISAFEKAGQGKARAVEAQALYTETLKKFDELVSVKVVDDHTLILKLQRPTPYFLDLLAFEIFSPVYPPLVDQYQTPNAITGRLDTKSDWTKPPLLVTNGMFKLTQWYFKRNMRFERNEHYWNQAAINVDSIDMPSVQDPNAQVLAVQTGGVDWLSDTVPDYRADMLLNKKAYYAEHQALYDSLVAQGLDPVAIDRRMPPDPRQNIHAFPAFGTYFWNFNCLRKLPDGRSNPFHDPRVRRAFAMTVDKQNIVDNVRRSGEQVTSTLIPVNSLGGYRTPKGLPSAPDPKAIAMAKQLLAEAGYANIKDLPVIELSFNTDGGHDKIAQALKRDWEQNLGVTVRLEMKEIKVFKDDLKKQNYMIGRAGWFGDYGDPTTFLDLMRKDDGNNDRKYGVEPHELDNYAKFESLMNQALDEPDAAKRLEQLAQAEQIIDELDLPYIPIFQYCQVMMFNPHKVSGPSPHPRQKQHIYLLDMLGDGKGSDKPLEIPPETPGGPPSKVGGASRTRRVLGSRRMNGGRAWAR